MSVRLLLHRISCQIQLAVGALEANLLHWPGLGLINADKLYAARPIDRLVSSANHRHERVGVSKFYTDIGCRKGEGRCPVIARKGRELGLYHPLDRRAIHFIQRRRRCRSYDQAHCQDCCQPSPDDSQSRHASTNVDLHLVGACGVAGCRGQNDAVGRQAHVDQRAHHTLGIAFGIAGIGSHV